MPPFRHARATAAVLLAGATLAIDASAVAQQRSLNVQLDSVRAQNTMPALAAAVVKGGAIVAAGAVGVRVQGGNSPVTIDDRFHLGSDTKAMTATLAGMMVDEGRLRWSSTIGEVLGGAITGMNPKLAAVTLAQLLSHSSGIPSDTKEMIDIYESADAYDYNLPALRLRALRAWGKNEPKVPAPSPFQYANFGYIIAGSMIETAAGVPWERLIRERLFAPLGLASGGLGPQATLGRIDAPVGHKFEDDGKVTPMLWGPAADVPMVMGPAGNAHMSIGDFARWAAWNVGQGRRGPALVKRETLAEIHRAHVQTPRIEKPQPGTPQTGHYAYGWGVVKFEWTARPVLTHNGSNSMNLAKILVDTDGDVGVVVTTNIAGEKADDATRALMERLYREFAAR
jgi:CubicO group peptidase (beta-lactamase class C family)